MIDLEKIIAEKNLQKQELADILGDLPQNINRTIKRLSKNLSEIEEKLSLLGISLESELGRNNEKGIDDRLLGIIEAEKREKADLFEMMKSQQEIIKELSKKADAFMEGKLDVAK